MVDLTLEKYGDRVVVIAQGQELLGPLAEQAKADADRAAAATNQTARSVAGFGDRDDVPVNVRPYGLWRYVRNATRVGGTDAAPIFGPPGRWFEWNKDQFGPGLDGWRGENTTGEILNIAAGAVQPIEARLDARISTLGDMRIAAMSVTALEDVATPRVEANWHLRGFAPTGQTWEWGGYAIDLNADCRGLSLPVDWVNPTGLIAIGDSMFDNTVPDRVAAKIGIPADRVRKPAKYSAGARQVYRVGVKELRLTVEGNMLPAGGGSVAITAINEALPGKDNPASFLFTYDGDAGQVNNSLSGMVAGQRVVASVSTGGGSDYRLTVNGGQTGAPLPAGSVFVPDFAENMKHDIAIIRISQNSFKSPFTADKVNPEIYDHIDLCVRALRGQPFIIVGLTPAATWLPGTEDYAAVRAANAGMRARWPKNYMVDANGRDNLERMIQGGDQSDGDIADRANQVVPRSLREPGDPLHFNDLGEEREAQGIYECYLRLARPPVIDRSTEFSLTVYGQDGLGNALKHSQARFIEFGNLAKIIDPLRAALNGALTGSAYRATPADGADLPNGAFYISVDPVDNRQYRYQRVAAAPGYVRGRLFVDKADAGLPLVQNIAPDKMPVSDDQRAAITKAVTDLVGGAPGALDTLKELADAIADDANFAVTVTNALGLRPTSALLSAIGGGSLIGLSNGKTVEQSIIRPSPEAPTYLRALGDAMDDLPRSIKSLVPGISGGGADMTTKFINAIAQGAKNVFVPFDTQGDYFLDGTVQLASGLSLRFNKGVRLTQRGFGVILLDGIGCDDMLIDGLSIYYPAAIANPGGAFRGDSKQTSGIWLNGNRNKVIGFKSLGLQVGVWLSPYNPVTNANDLRPVDNEIDDLYFEAGTFGVLIKGQANWRINNVRGKNIFITPNTTNPAHLVYATGFHDIRSNEGRLSNVQARDCTSTAVQLKYIDGLIFNNIQVYNSDVMQITDCTDVVGSNIVSRVGRAQTNAGAASFGLGQQDSFLDTISKRVTLTNLTLDCHPEVDRAFGAICDDLVVRNMVIYTRHTSDASGVSVVNLGGVNQDVEADIRPQTAFYRLAAQARTVTGNTTTDTANSNLRPSDNIVVRLRSQGSFGGLRVEASATNSKLVYDPDEVVMKSGGTHLINANASAGTRLKRTAEIEIIAQKPSATFEIPAAATATRVIIRPGATNYAVAAPSNSSLVFTPLGTTLDLLIENTTGAALGAAAFVAIYKFKTGFVSPAAGASVNYKFRYDGTNWIEI